MAYSKSKAAKTLGISKEEFENRAKAAGFDTTEEYYNSIGGASAPIIQEITKQIIDLDRQLDALGPLGLTDEEKENFLEKAVELVQPYYDRESARIEAGITEGKVRSAEDILAYTRDVQNQVTTALQSLDLRTSETEEDFMKKVADITAAKGEDVEAKRREWQQRVENLKATQIQAGIFSSGIGKKKRTEYQEEAASEISNIESGAQRVLGSAEIARKYNLEQIRLAREATERERIAKIGSPQQTQETINQQLPVAGLSDIGQLGSQAQIEAARAQEARNITTYKPEALSSLQEERLKAVESRKQELQAEELTLRNQEYERQRQKILADKAAAQSRLSTYRY